MNNVSKIDITTLSIALRTGNMAIGGLPFTSNSDFPSSITVGLAAGLAITANQNVTGIVNTSATTISIQLWDATIGTTTLQDTEWTNNGRIILSGQYGI